MPDRIGAHLLNWASELEGEAKAQALRTSELSFIHGHMALMPDAHLGKGSTIGSVIPTLGAIIPAAVGVDIGCGMIAVETNIHASNLPENLDPLLSDIEQAVPAGVGQGHEKFDAAAKVVHELGSAATALSRKQWDTAARQMGTLGSGNHFVEICLDDTDTVWVVLHSGSRGIGNQLARIHIDLAKGLMKQYFIELADPDLAYFAQHTPEFDAYIHDLRWAQTYAMTNREQMMNAVLGALDEFGAGSWAGEMRETRRINCHHNYTEQEHHFGKDVWVTRKGAIRARVGDYGVIPGSMGTSSFIVRGLGNRASLDSAPHGAGRRMGRRAARREFTAEDLAVAMEGKTWLASKGEALLDEIPASYKDIDQVMRDSADLVEIETELTQILNYKGA